MPQTNWSSFRVIGSALLGDCSIFEKHAPYFTRFSDAQDKGSSREEQRDPPLYHHKQNRCGVSSLFRNPHVPQTFLGVPMKCKALSYPLELYPNTIGSAPALGKFPDQRERPDVTRSAVMRRHWCDRCTWGSLKQVGNQGGFWGSRLLSGYLKDEKSRGMRPLWSWL